MPYKRQHSAFWWASYTDANGKPIRRSTGTTDRQEAAALEAKWKLEAHQQKHWQREPERSFDVLMLAYLTAHTGKRSADRDRELTRKLRPWFQRLPLNTLNAAAIRGYIQARTENGVKPGTINRELALLSAAINWARTELEWNLPNPVRGRKLKEPEGRLRWISREEADLLINAARAEPKAPHLPDLIVLALNTAMRREELLGLEWQRIDLKANIIYLEGCHTKAGKRRSIPINSQARESLLSRMRFRAEHCPDTPWVFSDRHGNRLANSRKSFLSACARAGITDFKFHDLRHTCAAWLISAGGQIAAVRDLLGHSTIKMTERYAHLSPENVRQAVALLDGDSHSIHTPEKKPQAN